MGYLDLYYIDLKYIRDLSKTDDRVMSVSPQTNKENRPFVGVVVMMNGQNYCIPLTSPKDKFLNKKSEIDFVKIFDETIRDRNGSFKLIGVLNINDMIPVDKTVMSKVNLSISPKDTIPTKKYKELMQKQIRWCRAHSDIIINKANKVYDLVVNMPDKNKRLTRRCLNFKKLEQILEKRINQQYC